MSEQLEARLRDDHADTTECDHGFALHRDGCPNELCLARDLREAADTLKRQREALTALNAHLEAMQAAMVTYLTGGSDKAFIGDMLVMLDGPEQRDVQGRVRRVLEQK